MARLRLDASVAPRQRVALVARLTELVTRLQGARREALDCAIEIGQLLVGVSTLEERVSFLKEAGYKGKSKRTAQLYVRFAEHRDYLAQRAASSMRHADLLLRELYATSKKSSVKTLRLKLDNVSSPEELARTLRTVRGKSVSIEIRVTRAASVKPDRRQPPLPFD